MTTYTSDTFGERLEQEVKGLINHFVDEDYANAMNDAENETGFALPLADNTYEFYWYKERVKRHLFFYLYSEFCTLCSLCQFSHKLKIQIVLFQ